MTTLAWLRPPPPTGPEGIRAAELGPIGWQVLLHEAVLRPVWGDVAVPAGRPATPRVRAAALGALVPRRAAVGRASAVWVHTGGPVPGRVDVLVRSGARRPSPHPHRVPHECRLPADDLVTLGDVRVTTVLRTALDVARWLPPRRSEPLLRRLVDVAGLDPHAAIEALERCPGRERPGQARPVLEACLAESPARRQA